MSEEAPLLIARLSGEELCRIDGRKVPADQRIRVRLLTQDPKLELIDSGGKARTYDLSSAVAEGLSIAAFTFRVGPTYRRRSGSPTSRRFRSSKPSSPPARSAAGPSRTGIRCAARTASRPTSTSPATARTATRSTTAISPTATTSS